MPKLVCALTAEYFPNFPLKDSQTERVSGWSTTLRANRGDARPQKKTCHGRLPSIWTSDCLSNRPVPALSSPLFAWYTFGGRYRLKCASVRTHTRTHSDLSESNPLHSLSPRIKYRRWGNAQTIWCSYYQFLGFFLECDEFPPPQARRVFQQSWMDV